MTLLPETHAPDAYQALRAQFSEQEQVMLILVIVAINGWKLAHIFARKMSRIVRYGFISGLPGFVTI